MSIAIYGQPRCPACSEELAPKTMAFSCGSCGHTVVPERRCGGPRSLGCLLGFGVMLLCLGAYADFESTQLHRRINVDLADRLRIAIARNREMTADLAQSRDSLRHAEARERCGLARIELLRERLTELTRERDRAVHASHEIPDADALDDMIRKLLDEDEAAGGRLVSDDELSEEIGRVVKQSLGR